LLTFEKPFREQYPVNPSWEIARDLPTYLPTLRAKDPKSRDAPSIPPVRILVYPEPIRVNYKVVRELVPSLWETYKGRKVDIVVHIGMAGPRPFYCIERKGHRDGYEHDDVDGETPNEEEERKPDSDWIWRGLPKEIETDLVPEDILKRWQEYSAVSLFYTCWNLGEMLTIVYRRTWICESRTTQDDTCATSSTTRAWHISINSSGPGRSFFFTYQPTHPRQASRKDESWPST
jgi:pyrrolidone-carboxylate peptidase